ncbi:MAG: dipeptidase [Lachnospiraceae bacterium]|nr:dipeptidase [Lachnospiraceae bacterium]
MYIDMHCDTLLKGVREEREEIYELPEAMADVKRLKEAQVICQFFAIFFPPKQSQYPEGIKPLPEDEELFKKAREIFQNTIQKHGEVLGQAVNYQEVIRQQEAGRVAGILTMEDGRAVLGSFERLQYFYSQGVRLISLTWNYENCFGAPNSKDVKIMQRGLTSFGKEAVGVMNDLGILVDVSHLSDGGFWDVAALSKKPFVASHSNCRSLCNHTRNLTDEMIHSLAEHGGVAGVNFEPTFLQEGKQESTMERIAAHIKHFVQIGGEECVGIGTDFDGIQGVFEVGEPTAMERLFAYLHRSGFSEDLIEKIAYRNVFRVIKESMK